MKPEVLTVTIIRSQNGGLWYLRWNDNPYFGNNIAHNLWISLGLPDIDGKHVLEIYIKGKEKQ